MDTTITTLKGETGRDAYVFQGTSPGAARIGAIRLDPA